MATTTPNYGWTVPTSTDLVKDGATAIETLGDAIDASMNTALGTKKAGMVLLNTTSFSGVSSASLPASSFSSTYDNYYVTVNYTAVSATSDVFFRIRSSGTDLTGAVYQTMVSGLRTTGSALTIGQTNQTALRLGDALSNAPFPAFHFTLFSPFLTAQTRYLGQGFYRDTTSLYGVGNIGVVDNAISYDSCTVYPSTGTISGTITCYGVTK